VSSRHWTCEIVHRRKMNRQNLIPSMISARCWGRRFFPESSSHFWGKTKKDWA
jgi:hypothetical protein